MSNRKKFFAVIFLAIVSIGVAYARQNKVPKIEPPAKVVDFRDLGYPVPAAITHTQGAVVIKAKLNSRGEVQSAEIISGVPYLALAAVSNVESWRFEPNAENTAVVVYNFVFIEGRCQSHGSLFVLQPSNVALVLGCEPGIDAS